ncbi:MULTISPECIES: antitoxin Xre/MbcA/ParS toxin-binding domain-containing protein [unclassified Mesorhizobium]|uniref:antitoxin Xre/MbcA/ParS-like domain-containing protein n=1 Tax=unclassified Mesorhizobium TaxID=325217 RepID=UPI001FDF7B6A|nr:MULTISPECIES: antitoxin Xre/MbcA/ParS toxin-binding domain-containing protein [unclassified Mesorhizobium]
MQRYKLIVLSSAGSGDGNENAIADSHQSDVLQVPGIVSAQQFRRAEHPENSMWSEWSHMAVYECEAKDIGLVIDELKARSDAGDMLNSATQASPYIGCFVPVTDLKCQVEPVRPTTKGARWVRDKNTRQALPSATRDSDSDVIQAGWTAVDSRRIEDWAGPVAGPTYLEANLQIPRSTLHRWQRRNQVIALRRGLGRHVFPLAQFVDGRPVFGMTDILAMAKHPRLAWFWLVSPSPYLGGRPPIELLRRDLVEDVVRAARHSGLTGG